ncbi:MAG: alpha-glucosidase/alpha-galactosidase [Armatimonadota bacterium]|nr:alpha-glucosidase/alpha-galactosidase [Armatimonadota bacterium]
MPKITLIGAGSVVFAKNILSDCMSYPELADSTYVLYDIDPGRLETAEKMARQVAKAWNANPTLIATTDPRQALDGADYAVNMIQVGGYEPCTVTDFEVPKKYGLRQTIGDTLGIGGIFRALRTIPVMLEYARLMEEVCPEVTFLNYVNPMAMNTWAMLAATEIDTVGLCHSVQGSYRHLVKAIGVNPDEVNYTCAGINHMAFYLTLEHEGEDLYPRIFEAVQSGAYAPDWDRVRLDMMLRIGYYITESSEHFSEYHPWYIKRDRPDLIEKYNIPLDEYPRRCIAQNKSWARMASELAEGKGFDRLTRSSEYGSRIIHAMETGEPTVIHGNVLNDALIDNLPDGCCVEVPCLVDKNGIQPLKVGPLLPHLAALNRSSINVQELTVMAALTGEKDYVYHAAMMDPHTAAELSLDEIWSLVDDLFAAHGDWIPLFREEAARADR